MALKEYVLYPLIFTSCGISIILSLIFLFLAIKMIYYQCYETNKTMIFVLFGLFIIQIISYLISEISYIVYWICIMLYFNKTPYALSIVLSQNLYIFFWIVGNSSFNIILILRLYFTFYNTSYQVSKCIVLLIFVLISGLIITYICLMMEISSPNITMSDVMIYSLLVLFNIIIGFCLMYLFLSNLFDVAVKQSVAVDVAYKRSFMEDDEINSKSSLTSFEFQPRSIEMLQLIAKHTVLAISSIMIVQIYWIFEGIQQLYKDDDNINIWNYNLQTFQTLLIIRMFMRCFAIFIEMFCVYLSFGVNANLYSYICSKCHIKFEHICKKYAKKRIKNENVQYKIGSGYPH